MKDKLPKFNKTLQKIWKKFMYFFSLHETKVYGQLIRLHKCYYAI